MFVQDRIEIMLILFMPQQSILFRKCHANFRHSFLEKKSEKIIYVSYAILFDINNKNLLPQLSVNRMRHLDSGVRLYGSICGIELNDKPFYVSEKDLRKYLFQIFALIFAEKRSRIKMPLKNVMSPIVGVFKSFDDYGKCVGL